MPRRLVAFAGALLALSSCTRQGARTAVRPDARSAELGPDDAPNDRSVDAERVVTLFTTATGGPTGIALDAAHVYWTNGCEGTVARMPRSGGAVEILASAQSHPAGIAVDATYVYWTDEGTEIKRRCQPGDPLCVDTAEHAADGAVMSAPKGGGKLRVIAANRRDPRAIAVDGKWVYWAEHEGGGLFEAATSGGPPRAIVQPSNGQTDFTLDGASIYWAGRGAGDTVGAVMKVARSGGPPVTLVEAATFPGPLALGHTSVFYVLDGGIKAMPRAGGAPVELVPERGSVGAIAVDTRDVFWTDVACRQVKRMPTGGGTEVVVHAEPGSACEKGERPGSSGAPGEVLTPTALAVDAAQVFWIATSEGSGEAGRCPRPGAIRRRTRAWAGE